MHYPILSLVTFLPLAGAAILLFGVDRNVVKSTSRRVQWRS